MTTKEWKRKNESKRREREKKHSSQWLSNQLNASHFLLSSPTFDSVACATKHNYYYNRGSMISLFRFLSSRKFWTPSSIHIIILCKCYFCFHLSTLPSEEHLCATTTNIKIEREKKERNSVIEFDTIQKKRLFNKLTIRRFDINIKNKSLCDNINEIK